MIIQAISNKLNSKSNRVITRLKFEEIYHTFETIGLGSLKFNVLLSGVLPVGVTLTGIYLLS